MKLAATLEVACRRARRSELHVELRGIIVSYIRSIFHLVRFKVIWDQFGAVVSKLPVTETSGHRAKWIQICDSDGRRARRL